MRGTYRIILSVWEENRYTVKLINWRADIFDMGINIANGNEPSDHGLWDIHLNFGLRHMASFFRWWWSPLKLIGMAKPKLNDKIYMKITHHQWKEAFITYSQWKEAFSEQIVCDVLLRRHNEIWLKSRISPLMYLIPGWVHDRAKDTRVLGHTQII